MIKTISYICIITVLFMLLIENNVIGAIESKSNSKSEHLPILSDPSLKVELIYQGDFKVEANELSPVTAMTFLGHDILLLSKNVGTVHRIINANLLDSSLLDVNVANERERGLLGISTSDAKDSNVKYVFLYYTESKKSDNTDVCHTNHSCEQTTETIGNRLYRYEIKDNKLVDPRLLLSLPAIPGPSHNGGAIIIGPDNNLYLSVGDLVGSVNESSSTKAQNFKDGTEPDGRAGILRITQDGRPVSNKVLGNNFPLDLYYAYGIRNSFGLDFDPLTGNLWDTENGPEYGDEINLVRPGFNSGWMKVQGIWKPIVSPAPADLIAGNKTLHPTGLANFGGKGSYSPPELIWKKTVAPTAIKFLNSDKLGEKYENDIFVSDMKYGRIYHFNLNDKRDSLILTGKLADKIADSDEETKQLIFGSGFGAITDLDVGPDGLLYVLSVNGPIAKIYRIVLIGHD